MKYFVLFGADYGYHFHPDKEGFDTLEQAITAEKDIRGNGFRDTIILKEVKYQTIETEESKNG